MLVLSLKNGNNDPGKKYFNKCYMLLAEIKVFHALINNKPFINHPVKNKQEAFQELFEMSRNDGYTTGNLLDYFYHQSYYKVIDTHLSRQTNTNIPEQANFRKKLKEDDPSRQILVPRTSRWRLTPTSPGCPLKILFDRLGDVPIWRPGSS